MLSPLIFNLFINELPNVFINDPRNANFCDPVFIKNEALNCLMWADDCAIFSRCESGIQNCINIASDFFNSQGLHVNVKKTKLMVFNVKGLGSKNFANFNFTLGGSPLEMCESYTYLGLVFRPSASGKYL